jgi:hypothetical protein
MIVIIIIIIIIIIIEAVKIFLATLLEYLMPMKDDALRVAPSSTSISGNTVIS